jgi:ankyrin repeat protein
VNAKDKDGWTPLHWAVCNDHLEVIKKEVIKKLISAGANVNAKDKYGETPLHRAAYNGHLEVTKILILRLGQM